ncbi:MAG: hypothetical protein K2P81_05410 [Bacteriovoracaceae bacterium]|nr:hypothetical protein [Bacteriovoracaceae bacterium]
MNNNEGSADPSFLDKLTFWHGKISDSSAIWFPFVFLKPKPNELITHARRLVMVMCFTAYGSLFWPLKQWIFSEEFNIHLWAVFSLKCLAFFTIWFRLVTAPLWNRRARSL